MVGLIKDVVRESATPGCNATDAQGSNERKLSDRIRVIKEKNPSGCRVMRLRKSRIVFVWGDSADAVYFIETGQIKLVAPTLDGEEGLVGIYSRNDVFGESCLFGQSVRLESAIAMTDSVVVKIPARTFQASFHAEWKMEDTIHHFVDRLADQRHLLSALMAAKKEDRLALLLLYLARKLGKRHSDGTSIEHRILHEELAAMTGMTRGRIGLFLKRFRCLGLVRTNDVGQLVVVENSIRSHLWCEWGSGAPEDGTNADVLADRTASANSGIQLEDATG